MPKKKKNVFSAVGAAKNLLERKKRNQAALEMTDGKKKKKK